MEHAPSWRRRHAARTRPLRMKLHLTVALIVVYLLVYGYVDAVEPVPQANDILTMVNVNSQKDIRLDANLYIPDGGELLLNIDVPREPIMIDAHAPAKVTRVYSTHADGTFGVGEDIDILVEFTSEVEVRGGAPTLRLATGCHSSTCHTREIQRLRCQGTTGKFAVSFDGQRVVNIPWDATMKQFGDFLKRMTKIDKALVDYLQQDGKACTFLGNNITITFESVNIDGVDGDIPEMTADLANKFGDGTSLGHVRFDPILSPQAWEIQKGKRVPDRLALYSSQPNSRTLLFKYTVQDGDNATILEYANSDSLTQSLIASKNTIQVVNAGTLTSADATLPPPKFAGDWERGMGSSLAKNSAICIDVSQPRVTMVTSPNSDGTFGIGEVLFIHVYFSLPVIVIGLPTVVLETGQVDRIIPFSRVTGASKNIVEFLYIVQAKDTSPDLTYTGTSALKLNGGSIKRKSTSPTTDAILTLPVNGERGSLSSSKNFVIDTTNPKVTGVTSLTADGTYTGGDTIQILVSFDAPVVVTGTPMLMLSTGSANLYPGSFVRSAPTPTSTKSIVFPSVDHGLSTAASQGHQFLIGNQVYTVSSVVGDVVTMVEDYTGTVVDPTDVNPPTIPIQSPGYRPARYTSGSGTKNLVFTYQIQLGDSSADLEYTSSSALQLNGGTIKRLSTSPFTDADTALPVLGARGSLGFGANLVINTDSPRVLQLNPLTRDGVYRQAEEIYLAVVFNLPVVVQPIASIQVTTGVADDRFAVYERGSGSTNIVFKFVCSDDDEIGVFDVIGITALRPSYGLISGFIRRLSSAPLIPAALDLPAAGISSKGISISQSCIYPIDVSASHEDDSVGAGEVVDIIVSYSAPVNVDTTSGTPTVRLSTNRASTYTSGSGSTLLTFRYIIQADDPPVRLTHNGIFSLELNGGTIKEPTTGKLASTVLPAVASTTMASQQIVRIDTSAPVVTEVSTRMLDGTYTVGDRIVAAVRMNYPVTVVPAASNAGSPVLFLHLGGSTNMATPANLISASDEQLFFAITITSSHSTMKLAYPSRVSLRCVGNFGINKDGLQNNALAPHGTEFQGRLFVVWSEISSAVGAVAQVRAKSLDIAQAFGASWRQEDGDGALGRVQFNSAMEATNPMLVPTPSGSLFVIWQERSSTATGNPFQICVAVYTGGDISVLQRWQVVDHTAPTAGCINRDPLQAATSPHAVVHSGNLYAAWHETISTSAATQIRVAVFQGHLQTPAWSFVDGNIATRGINYASTRAARNVRLSSCRSTLYATWEEVNSAGVSQIRVASLPGSDVSPRWLFVDGNSPSIGLNYDAGVNARAPSIACLADATLIVAWHRETVVGGVTRTQIRAKQLSLGTPGSTWRSADGGLGIFYSATQSASNVRLRVHPANPSVLFATWHEVNAVPARSQVRVASFAIEDQGSWSLIDGASRLSVVNDASAQDASFPVLVPSTTTANVWFVVWQERHVLTQTTHVRAGMYRAGTFGSAVWQSLHDRCVQRRSTAPTTASNLLLPEINTMGALDFKRDIRIDTSRPVIQSVSFYGASNVISAASAVQTIDVFNAHSLTRGQYQLVYEGEASTCIDWNAPAAVLTAALQGIPGLALSVQIELDTTSFQDARRYFVTFLFPTSLKPLRVYSSSSCAAWVCTAATPTLPCNLRSLVQLNADRNVLMRTGMIDIVMQFTSPVVTTIPTPTLTLETGATDTQASYTTRGILRVFDVGTESPSEMITGAIRLAYGDKSTPNAMELTECIDASFSHHADAEQELRAKLLAIKRLKTIGISTVTRSRRRNGFRYVVMFSNSSAADLLDLIPADSTMCDHFAGRIQTIDVKADTKIFQGEYQIRYQDEISPCISATLRANGPVNSVQAWISQLVPNRIIPVQVSRDTSVFGTSGHRYYVSFMALGDAVNPLRVVVSGACSPLMCEDNNGGPAIACTGVAITANADFKASLAVTDTLEFQYSVQSTDSTRALSIRDVGALAGDVYRQSQTPTLPIVRSIPTALLSPSQIRILGDAEIPRIVKVSSPTLDDTYTAGDIIVLYVAFSDPVDVAGTPILELNSNGIAKYLSGGGTSRLEFRYRISAGESSPALDYLSTLSLRIPSRFVRVCAAGTINPISDCVNADLTLPVLTGQSCLSAQSTLVVDTAVPTVMSVNSTRADTVTGSSGYGVGDIIDIVVQFTSEVAVSGEPKLALTSGGTAHFTYGGYQQLLDIGVHVVYPITTGQFALSYQGVTSGCVDVNDPASSAPTSLKSRLLEYDELSTIGVISVTRTQKKNGFRFEIIFDSSRVLEVPGSVIPVITDVCAPLLPSSSDSSPESLLERATDARVVFHYTIHEDEVVTRLDYAPTTLDLSSMGTTIRMRSRTPTISADVTLPAAASPSRLGVLKNLKIDGTPVTIVDVISDTAGGTYGVAFPPLASPPTVYPGEILFRVIFSRAVKVIGSPTIELATGSLQSNGVFLPNRFARFIGQPQPNEAAFLYHIQEGDYSANLAFANLNVLADAQVYCVSASSATMARTAPLPRLLVSGTATIKIDATSVPTTVKLSSPHPDGTYGAGEAIAIEVTFSKQVTIQTGLNRDQNYFARHPVVGEFHNMVVVAWTEWSSFDFKPSATKSYLYIRAFTSDTLQEVSLTPAVAAPVNRFPDTFIERASLTVWNNELYMSWDENGLLRCARFNGITSPVDAWTVIPNIDANKNLQMRASESQVLVHNLKLMLVWREEAVVLNTGTLAGQIRVAQRNDDYDAPLWIYHDGNKPNAGLNKDPSHDAKHPHAVLYRGAMFLAWSEYNSSTDAYEIVVARRYVQSRDVSVWQYLQLASGAGSDFYISSYRPGLAVRRKGYEDAGLFMTWYRTNDLEKTSEVLQAEVLDTVWEPSKASVPQQVDSNLSTRFNGKSLKMVACGDKMFASWIEERSPTQSLRLATLPADRPFDSAWVATFSNTSAVANHNTAFDVADAALVCSLTGVSTGNIGVFWTEFDGFSTKLRLRHSSIPQRLESEKSVSWGETPVGSPLLELDTQTVPAGYAFASDRSGLQSHVLRFLYVVQPGQTSLDLDVIKQQALILNGAQVRDFYNQLPAFTLFPRSQDPRSLSFNNAIVIDTVVPVVVDVTSATPSGVYGVGEKIFIQIKFSLPVAVSGDLTSPPLLYIRSDELHLTDYTANAAVYASGSGSDTLVFTFTTTDRDYCERLDYFRVDSLVLPSSQTTIRRNSTFPTTDASLTLPPPRSPHSLSGNRQISIKHTQPTVIDVTSPCPDGVYYPGDAIPIVVTFTLPVYVYGAPAVVINTGARPTNAFYDAGNGTTALTFMYYVAEGDSSSDLDVVDDRGSNLLNYVHSLDLIGMASIKRKSTTPRTDAIVTLPAPGLPRSLSKNKNIVVDTARPQVIDVRTTTPDGTYDVGQEIEILVEFSKRVVVLDGSPYLKVDAVPMIDGLPRTAMYSGGSGTSVLRFVYTVQDGDYTANSPFDILDQKALVVRKPRLGGGTFQTTARVLCWSSNPVMPAHLTMPQPGPIRRINAVRSLEGNGHKVFLRTDGFRVLAMEADVASGLVYAPGHNISIFVIFPDIVVVQGTPRIKLNANALIPTNALYMSGSGTSKLTFQYTVVTGDSVDVLEAASREALELPAGSMILDASASYVPLRLGAPLLPGSLSYNYKIGISSAPPVVQRVYTHTVAPLHGGGYGVGDDIVIAVQFSRVVAMPVGSATPSLLLQFVNGPRAASYVSGNQTATLLFVIRITAGDSATSLDFANVNALVIPASPSGLFAAATTLVLPASATLPSPGAEGSLSVSSSVKVSSTPPTVVQVEALDRDGTYGLSDRLQFRVNFSFPVIVGTPTACGLELFLGGSTTTIATYTRGSATSSLIFEYRIAPGDRSGRLDYRSPASLGCSLFQLSANPSLVVDTVLPAPGAIGSLGFSSRIRVDSTAPRVLSVSSSLTSGLYGVGQDVDILITYSEPIDVLSPELCAPSLRLAVTNAQVPLAGVPSATFRTGSGSSVLTFRYTTRSGDVATPLGLDGVDALWFASVSCGFVATSADRRLATLRLPVPGTQGSLRSSRDIRINGVDPPRIVSVSSSMADGVYTAGDKITITVTFSTPVTVAGTPSLKLAVGQPSPGIATYDSGSGSNVITFSYPVQIGDQCERLEYEICPKAARRPRTQSPFGRLVTCGPDFNALQLGVGGSIKRLSTTPTTDAVLDLPEVTTWPKIRVATPHRDFRYVDQLDDTSGLADEERQSVLRGRGTSADISNMNLYRSLSYNKALQLDTQVPRVSNIYTNKYPGTYVLGETLDLVVVWSVPVAVITSNGLPSVAVSGSQQATYSAVKSSPSESVFIYTVTTALGDLPIEYDYDFRSVIRLNGGAIKRAAAVPTIDADLELVWAERFTRFASKHQIIQDVRLTLRGLYHPEASDLSVKLYHGARSAVVVDRCCSWMAFGEPDAKVRMNTEQLRIYPVNPTSGVGWDYGFQDFVKTTNLAKNGGAAALQSSTSGRCVASNAIDGRVRGMVTRQDVARTGATASSVAWWQLRLVRPTAIGTIRVWLPQRPDKRHAVVQIIGIDSHDGVAQVYGSFTLSFTTWEGNVHTTPPINWNAAAMVRDEDHKIANLGIGKGESMEAKILAALAGSTAPKQRLFVTRSPADPLLSPNGAFTWSVTFLEDTYLFDRDTLPLAVDGNNICDGMGFVKLSTPFPGDDYDEWSYISRDDDGELLRRPRDHIASMFPFWIVVYDDATTMEFETFSDSLKAAKWTYRVDESHNMTRLVSVNPPVGLQNAQVVRILAENPRAFLTLAEVEVFQERNHLLSQYTGGTPIATEFYPGAESWSPEDSFQERFAYMTSEGTWILSLRDVARKQQSAPDRPPLHGEGAISDWVLHVTSIAGHTKTYYMDIQAHIHSLPRFGKLYVSIAQTDTEHLDRDQNGVLDLVEADAYLTAYYPSYVFLPSATQHRVLWNFHYSYVDHGGIEILVDASERQKIFPSPVCDRQCLEDLGIDPYYAGGTAGDRALKAMEITRDRVVRFIPTEGFTGEDAFTYSISIGSQRSAVLGTVELHVQACQDPQCERQAPFLHRRRINPY